MNRTLVLAIDAALCAFLASGCATRNAPQPQITPVLEVRHGGLQADGYYELGRFLQEQQRYGDAVTAYRKALALDPKHADAHNGLGTVYALLGQYAEAHVEFGEALAHAPDHAAVLNNIGYTFLLERKPVEALAPLTKATELAPANARYSSNLVIALNNQSPARADGPASVAAPATFDAVPAPSQPAGPTVLPAEDATPAARLVAVGPNAFELVVAGPIAPKPMLAALPTSHGRIGIEVSNGNGAGGMARRVGRQLQAAGLPVARLTNQIPYGQFASRVEYRPGHEGAAADLSARVPGRPPLMASIGLRSDIDVRLVLGRELPAKVALLEPGEQVAHYAAPAD